MRSNGLIVGSNAEVKGWLHVNGNTFIRSGGQIIGDLLTETYAAQSQEPILFGNSHTNAGLQEVSFELQPAVDAGGEDQNLEPNQTVQLNPGAYGNVIVKTSATLKLTGGEYHFSTLSMEPKSFLEIQLSDEPAVIFVHGGAMNFKDSAQVQVIGGDASDVLWLKYGGGRVVLHGQARGAGTIIAPDAFIESSSFSRWKGVWWAYGVEMHQYNTNPLEVIPYDAIIQSQENAPRVMRDLDNDGLSNEKEMFIGSNWMSDDTDGLLWAVLFQVPIC
jgi:hypothetical protein